MQRERHSTTHDEIPVELIRGWANNLIIHIAEKDLERLEATPAGNKFLEEQRQRHIRLQRELIESYSSGGSEN